MIAPLSVKGAVLMAFTSRDPNRTNLHRPWFNARDGIAYASDSRTLVRVCNLLAAPCEVADWSTAPKDMDKFFTGVELLEDVSYRDLMRAAEIARVQASLEYDGDSLAGGFDSPDDMALVRVRDRFFRAEYVARICTAIEMLYDGVDEPRVFMGGATLMVAHGGVQALAMHFYIGELGACPYGFVVVDAATLEQSEGALRKGAR